MWFLGKPFFPYALRARALGRKDELARRLDRSSVPIGQQRHGFCNPFCRDKTVADPEAWPEFMAIYQS